MVSATFAVLAALAVVAITYKIMKTIAKNKVLADLPSVSVFWVVYQIKTVGMIQLFSNLAHMYPESPLIRIRGLFGSTFAVLLSHPDAVKEAWQEKFENFDKTGIFEVFRRVNGNTLSAITNEMWHSHRPIMDQTFTHKNLHLCWPIFVKHVDALEKKLKQDIASGGGKAIVNFVDQINSYCMDAICEVTLGFPVGAITDPKCTYSKNVITLIAQTPLQLSPIGRLWLSSTIKLRNAINPLRRLADSALQIKNKEPQPYYPNKDALVTLVDVFASADNREEVSHMTKADLIAEIVGQIAGGLGGPPAALYVVFHILATRMDIQEKAAKEVATLFGSGNNSRPIPENSVNDLKYIRNIINEAMRVGGPFVATTRRATRDDTLCGHPIPEGTTVIGSPVLLQNHPKFVTKPEEFNPDRFEDGTPVGFWPFGVGKRTCIGMNYAQKQMPLLVGALLQRFRFKEVEPFKLHKFSVAATPYDQRLMVELTLRE